VNGERVCVAWHLKRFLNHGKATEQLKLSRLLANAAFGFVVTESFKKHFY